MKAHILLLSTVILLFLPGSAADAAVFTFHENMDMLGFDIPTSVMPNPIQVPLRASPSAEVAYCESVCNADARCMAYTWVRKDIQGPTPMCWFKSSARIADPDWHGLMTVNLDTATGVKVYQNRPCWARHIFNLKFCNVVLAGSSSSPHTLECPQESRRVTNYLERALDGGFPEYCVSRMGRDPGGLPNCTDAFGHEANTPGVLGNYVNHACLDAN